MVYKEVIVAASVVAVLAMARKTGAAEWPSGPAGLPIDEADLISGDETGPSDSWKSNAERAQTSPCDQNGGMCIKKKDVRSCNGNIEEKYKCPTRKYRCCINDTIGNRIQEIIMLLNNVINSNSEMEMELSQVKENQETLLANVTNSNSEISMELSQVKDNQETLLANVDFIIKLLAMPSTTTASTTTPTTTTTTTTTTMAPTTTAIETMPSTTTASTTTMAPTTTAIEIPSGFEKLEDGRVIRRTVSSDPRSKSYDTQMDFCDQYGAKPFIPRTQADYLLYKEVRESFGNLGYMWLPANDRQEEGTLRWFNGEVASNTLFRWKNGQELIFNSASYDCVFYGCCSKDDDGVYVPDVHLYPCNALSSYPPICEII